MDEKKDKGLQGNEKIEEAILALQQEPTEELLAHALTVVRRRMREQGQLIVAVEPPSADVQEAVTQAAGTAMRLQAVQTSDGKKWWSAFTGFEEELKNYEWNTGVLIADLFEERKLDPMAVPCVLCKNHGPFTWGKDAHEAVHNAVVLELSLIHI